MFDKSQNNRLSIGSTFEDRLDSFPNRKGSWQILLKIIARILTEFSKILTILTQNSIQGSHEIV